MLRTAFAFVVLAVVPLGTTTLALPIRAQSTAQVFGLPITHPEVDFEGTWINVNQQDGVVARVEVTRRGDTWFAHLWGACATCDWGEQPLGRAGDLTAADARLRLTSIWTRGIGAGVPDMTNVELALTGRQLELTYRSYAVSSSSPIRRTERFNSTEKAPADARTTQPRAAGAGGGVLSPRPIKRATPSYTGPAMRARIEGTVWVQGIVEVDGTLSDVHVVRSLDQKFGLDEEAVKAANQWRFIPGTKDGQPVRVVITIEIEFRIRDRVRP